MKTTTFLLFLLASVARLFADEDGGADGKAYKCDAPNGRFSVRADQEKGYGQFAVEIVEAASQKPVLTFQPKARFISAAWSSDSKLVAIEQNRSTHESAVSVYLMDPKAVKERSLPKECVEATAAALETMARKHAKKADSLPFHFTSEGLQIVKWLSPDELVLSLSGMGWWGGVPAGDNDTRFLAEYEVTIHFATDGTSSLQKTALKKYDEL